MFTLFWELSEIYIQKKNCFLLDVSVLFVNLRHRPHDRLHTVEIQALLHMSGLFELIPLQKVVSISSQISPLYPLTNTGKDMFYNCLYITYIIVQCMLNIR